MDIEVDEYIENIQLKIQANQAAIRAAIEEYRLVGSDYEVRNLKSALLDSKESVENLTEKQIFNLEWCVEIVGL